MWADINHIISSQSDSLSSELKNWLPTNIIVLYYFYFSIVFYDNYSIQSSAF